MYCAEKLHSVLYNYSGYWLGSAIKTSRTGPSIRISVTDDSKDGGFRVFVDGEELSEPYIQGTTYDRYNTVYPKIVPEGYSTEDIYGFPHAHLLIQ